MIEVGAFFAPVVADILKNFVSEGTKSVMGGVANKLGRDNATNNLRLVVRERLIRELNFNLEVLGDEKLLMQQRIEELDISVIEFVFSQPLPLEIFLSTGRPSNSEAHLKKLKAKGWNAENYTEINLLERIWLRMSIAKVRSKHKASLGDMKYIRALMMGLRESLREQN